MSDIEDIFTIGGGVNGCGIARDAAGRGFSIRLAEMNDLASGASSWSSKLIHGGLRYLEYYEFRLVRESLSEREVLLKMREDNFQVFKQRYSISKVRKVAILLRTILPI